MSLFKKPSKVYIVEFLVMHFALLGILYAGSSIFNIILDQSKDESGLFGGIDVYTSLLGVDTTILAISYGLVSTVVFWWLYSRTSRSEILNPALTNSRRRRLLQYIFLSITGLIMLTYTVSLTYTVLLEVFGENNSILAEDWWRTVLKQGFALLLAVAISYFVANNVDPKGQSNDNK